MPAITSLIAIIDADRQSSNIVAQIDGADAITGLWTIIAKIIPKDKASFTPRTDAVPVQKLFQYAI